MGYLYYNIPPDFFSVNIKGFAFSFNWTVITMKTKHKSKHSMDGCKKPTVTSITSSKV